MLRTGNIHKLSDFRANATAHLARLAKTGAIEVLTVNGQAKGVVMSPKTFDDLADRIEQLEIIESVKLGLADAAAGRTRPARASLEKLAKKIGLDLQTHAS